MVRVFRCHRFVSQRVVSTSSEPTVICSSGDRLFVACDNYLIEEFDLKTPDCHKVRQFYAISHVIEMVYSCSGEFLATIEEDTFKGSSANSCSDFSFRVYSNLGAISKGNPMKVRLSGQVIRARARKRTADVIETSQLIVIETPLKRAPTCIAAYAQNIAVAAKRTVLVYACEKNADTTQDIRCILELEFVFTVRKLELCEEFVMCSSGLECQIVQLNFNNSVKSVIDVAENIPSRLSVKSFLEHKVLRSTCDDKRLSHQNHCADVEITSSTSENHFVVNDSASNEAVPQCEHGSTVACKEHVSTLEFANRGHEDNRSSDLNCSMKRALIRQAPVSDCSSSLPSPPPSPPPRKTENRIKETVGGGLELLGPVNGDFTMCPVSVEFEGLERDGRGRNGVLKNGVTTLLYKKLEPHSYPFHSIQLLPVFVDEEISLATEATRSCLFLSKKRTRLVGMFSVVSTATFAYIYSLLPDCRLISSFPYAVETIQVKLTESHLYAMSEMRLDVYTARCLSRIIFDAEENGKEMQQTMPFVNEEPCLLGYHTFFDLTAMCQTGDHLTLLSKSASAIKSANDSWSIYVLKRPEISSLYNDMVDQAFEWEKTHQANSSGVLMQEANMLLRSHLYLQQSSDKKKELILLLRKSCLYLAHFYQSHDTKGHLAVPYYLMANYSLTDIVQSVQNSETEISSGFREALIWFCRKLTDARTTSDLISELEKAGFVNGCLKKLRAIATSSDDGLAHNVSFNTLS